MVGILLAIIRRQILGNSDCWKSAVNVSNIAWISGKRKDTRLMVSRLHSVTKVPNRLRRARENAEMRFPMRALIHQTLG